MIIKEYNSYLGLDSLEVAILDTDPKSADYLRIDSIPDELTAGKNVIKIFGNTSKFKLGSPIYIEVLDSNGNTVYTIMPEYYDSLKRRFIVINVTDETAPGPGLITICTTLNDNLVPAGWENTINFKWQFQINISPFQSNREDITFLNPPVVEMTTQVKPFVTASFRNNLEMITYEYGDYSYLDFTFEDHVGDSDKSENIFQKNKASSLLNSYTNTSITSFDRDNFFYLRDENFSAKQLVKNYPVINSGKGFYCTLGPNLIRNGTFSGSGTTAEYWNIPNTIGGTAIGSGGTYPYYLIIDNGDWVVQTIPNLKPGSNYLFMLDSDSSTPYYIELGYDKNRNSGSLSENVSAYTSYTNDPSPAVLGHAAIIQASDAGCELFIASSGITVITNIRLHEIQPIENVDFAMNSDMVGGYIKVHHPIVTPVTQSDYELYQIDPETNRVITKPDPAYQSYIDHILQSKDIAADDRFYYELIETREKNNPESQFIIKQKNDRFASNIKYDQQVLAGNFIDSYVIDSNVSTFPYTYVPLRFTLVDSTLYGIMYDGSVPYRGGIFTYDIDTKAVNFIKYFSSFVTPGNKLLCTKLPNNRKYLWGTTLNGGRFNSGSIFRLNTSNNIFSTLYHFGSSGSNGLVINTSGGVRPQSQLLQATDGLLYGITQRGGSNDSGVLYSFNTSSIEYRKIHDLSGNFGGSNIIQFQDSLYFTTPFSGPNTSGSILKYNISSSVTESIFSFNGQNGSRPNYITLGPDNWIYGITYTSSVASSGSVLYKINPSAAIPASSFQILVHFDAATTGSGAEVEPCFDGTYIYGTCVFGGTYGSGSVYRYNSASGEFRVLHHFGGVTNNDGGYPKGNFIRIGNSLYSTTTNGGTNGDTGTFYRIDRIGINQPYISKESGYIYHHNSVIPEQIPETASLISDYPRWTGPVALGSQLGLFAVVQLELKNLDPLVGDVSKLRLSAKQSGLKSDFVDLGVYSTKPTDVLMDTNFVNHVHYNDSPYRLTGYFKPTITTYYTSLAENPYIKNGLFNYGWATGSITNSYFTDSDFDKNIQFIDYPATNLPAASVARMNITSSTQNGMAYLVFTASSLPPTSSTLNTWQQISYQLLSGYPMPRVMDTSSYNFYTANSATDIFGLNNILVYSALFKKTASISLDDIYAISSDIPYATFNYTGSSPSSSTGEHPYIFHNKLGYKTDDYLITDDIASSGPVYMGLIFEHNSSSNSIFGTTASADSPYLIDVANVISREIGDREYMINRYWEWYSRNPEPNTVLACSASVTSNTDVLMDSAKIMAVSSSYEGTLNKNTIVFQTKNDYKFVKGTKYVLSFNAVSKINNIIETVDESIDSKFDYGLTGSSSTNDKWVASPIASWTSSSGYWARFNFDTDTSGSLIPPAKVLATQNPGGVAISGTSLIFYPSAYTFTIKTGEFTYSVLDNPTSLTIEFPTGTVYEITDLKPFSTFTKRVNINSTFTGLPKFTIKSTYTDFTAYATLLEVSLKSAEANLLTFGTPVELVPDYEINNNGPTTAGSINPLAPSSHNTTANGWTVGIAYGFGTASVNNPTNNGAITFLNADGNGIIVNQNYLLVQSTPLSPAPSAGDYLVEWEMSTGQITRTNPMNLQLLFAAPADSIQYGTILNTFGYNSPTPGVTPITANTSYAGSGYFTSVTPSCAGLFADIYQNVDNEIQEITRLRVRATPYTISNTSIVTEYLVPESKLTAYAVNSFYGAPFKDQLTTRDVGEFIGELVHTRINNFSGEVKNFGRIEMEFEAEVDGSGKIAFETNAGSEWYISEISVRPKDRVGLTPGYTKLFVKVPSDLVNIPLTFKIEYLNDYDVKSSYTTILNDVTFTNVKGNIADNKTGLNSSTLPYKNNGGDAIIDNTGGGLD